MKDIYLKIIKEDLSDFLPLVSISTIIIWGEKDKIKSVKEGHLIQEKIKGSKLEILPDVGHNPYLNNSQRLVGAILNFLR